MNYPSKSFDIQQDSKIDLGGIKGCNCGGNCFCQKAIDQAPLVILTVDSTAAVALANKETLLFFGCDESAIGKPVGEVLTPAHSDKWAEISSGLAERNTWQGDLLVRARDDSTRMLELSITRIFESDDSGKYRDMYIGRDISERKKKERDICLQEKIATRAEMAGEISHELNNYLSIVLGNLELMEMNIERDKFDNLASRVKSVREGMTRIAKFIEGLMAVEKPEIRHDAIEVRQFLEDEVFYFKSLPKFSDIEFACDWAGDIPDIAGDRCRLQQSIYNIFLNAADALAQGKTESKKITVTASHQQSDNTISIAIGDNGPGMSSENYQRLFKQFYSTKGHGHGFGLLAVKGAAKSFGGKVSAAPGPDGGACFTISIPIQKPAPTTVRQIMVPA